MAMLEKNLIRKQNANAKPLFLKRTQKITQAMKRVWEKHYHPVIKKYLIEYLDRTDGAIALSDVQLKSGLIKLIKSLDAEILLETAKWPFCDIESAMVFYALYYVQTKKFYYGESAHDLIDNLFKKNSCAGNARNIVDELYNLGQIIVTNEDSMGKRFAFDSFTLKIDKGDASPIEREDTAVLKDTLPLINAAIQSDYHPVVKEFLVEHLEANRFNGQMIRGEDLKNYINKSILAEPGDPDALDAMNETLKWSFKSEKKAWQFLALYYISIAGSVFMSKPGDLVDTLFLQGAHSDSFISGVKNVFYKKYEEGKLVITGIKGGKMRYELASEG